MPREYRTTTGPASPSPTSFGAADINLQTPRFVAQTAVAQPQNPFEALQKILGIGVDIGSQMLKMQTAEIEGKINYDRAVEAQKERVEVKSRRERADEAAEFTATQQLRRAKVETLTQAEALEEELKSTKEPESTEMKMALAAAIQGAESEGREISVELSRTESEKKTGLIDAARAYNVRNLDRIQGAVEAGNMEQLVALRDGYILAAENAPDPETRAAAVGLRTATNNEIEKLRNQLEIVNARKENAAAAKSLAVWTEASAPIVDRLSGNIPELEKQLEGTLDEDIRKTLVDTVRDGVLEARPEMMGIMASATEAENDAASLAINRSVDRVVDNIINIRNARNQREATETKILDYTKRASTDIGVLDEIVTDPSMTSAQQNLALRDATVSYINNGLTDVDDMLAAFTLLRHPERAVAAAADAAIKARIDDRTRALSLERQNIIQSTPNVGDMAAAGWNARFKTKDDLINWFLGGIGTDRETFESNPDLIHVLGPTVTNLGEQFDRDTAKTEIEFRRLDNQARAATREGRSTVKVEDTWKHSPLALAIADGSYVNLSPEQTYAMMHESLVGYADVAVPSSLAAVVIDGADNPQNFKAVQQFWRVMGLSVDPTVRNKMLTDNKYKKSFGVSVALDYMDFNPENPNMVIQNAVTDFAANMTAYEEPDKDSVEGRAKRQAINAAIPALAQGAGIDMSRVTDYSGIEVKEVMGKMSQVDREIMYQFATIAANYPDAAEQGGLMTEMMAKSGYRIYPITIQGQQQFRLVQNIPGRGGTTPLPDPTVLESREWTAYLNSKKSAIASDLSGRKQLDNLGTPMVFDPNKLGTVEVVLYDQNTRDGFATVRVWETNRWINIDSVRLTKEDFESFKATYKPTKMTSPEPIGRPKF